MLAFLFQIDTKIYALFIYFGEAIMAPNAELL